MTDIMSKIQRSRHMSLIRGRNTRFELEFLRLLSAELYPLGYRYRKHCRHVYGTPDVVFAKFKVAVFLDSDFWHGRNYDRMAPRMSLLWRQKIERNIARDISVGRYLRKKGWAVLRIGESEAKRRPHLAIKRIRRCLVARKK